MEHYEIVKESIFSFTDIDYSIKGRIVKIMNRTSNSAYMYDISHYCRLEQEADIYISSAVFGDSVEDVEYRLMMYVKRFESAAQIVKNPYY